MSEWVSEIGCLTSHWTIFQLYMWRHIDVQADWRRSWTYGRAPNAIDISQGSLTCPSKHRHGTTLFIRWFRHTAPISRLLRSRWGYGGHILNLNPPGPHGGWTYAGTQDQHSVHMTCIAVAAVPWYNICIVLQFDLCRYFIIVFNYIHML